jgi:hypothetical protein
MTGSSLYKYALDALDAGFETIGELGEVDRDLARAEQADDLEAQLKRRGRAILEAGGSWPEARPFFDKAEQLDGVERQLHVGSRVVVLGVRERTRTSNGLIDQLLNGLAFVLGMGRAAS